MADCGVVAISQEKNKVLTANRAAKCVVDHYTFDDSEDGGANDFRPSNSQTVEIEAICDQIRRNETVAYGGNFTSLKANFEISQLLDKLKELLPHGRFLEEVKARLGYDRSWCSRLRRLGRYWGEIQQAIQWAIETRRLERSEISVDFAISLYRSWQQAMADGGDNNSTQTVDGSEKPKKISRKELEKKFDDVSCRLQEALQLIARLESEIARLKKQLYPDVLIANDTVLALPAAE